MSLDCVMGDMIAERTCRPIGGLVKELEGGSGVSTPSSDHVQELRVELLALRETSIVSEKNLFAASGRVPRFGSDGPCRSPSRRGFRCEGSVF